MSGIYHIDMLKNLIKDASRPNMFEIDINSMRFQATDVSRGLPLLAKATKLPSITVKEYVYERAGQKIAYPTHNVEFGEASVTFNVDGNYDIRRIFVDWQVDIANWYANTSPAPKASVLSDVTIKQLDGYFKTVYAVKLTNAWPSVVGEIEYSHDSENQLESFTVDFKYSRQEVLKV